MPCTGDSDYEPIDDIGDMTSSRSGVPYTVGWQGPLPTIIVSTILPHFPTGLRQCLLEHHTTTRTVIWYPNTDVRIDRSHVNTYFFQPTGAWRCIGWGVDDFSSVSRRLLVIYRHAGLHNIVSVNPFYVTSFLHLKRVLKAQCGNMRMNGYHLPTSGQELTRQQALASTRCHIVHLMHFPQPGSHPDH